MRLSRSTCPLIAVTPRSAAVGSAIVIHDVRTPLVR
jgi:hypothetical protein